MIVPKKATQLFVRLVARVVGTRKLAVPAPEQKGSIERQQPRHRLPSDLSARPSATCDDQATVRSLLADLYRLAPDRLNQPDRRRRTVHLLLGVNENETDGPPVLDLSEIFVVNPRSGRVHRLPQVFPDWGRPGR